MTATIPAHPPSTTPPVSPKKSATPKKPGWRRWLAVLIPPLLLVVMAPIMLLVVISGGNTANCGQTPTVGIAADGGTPVAGLNARQTQIAATIIGHVGARKLPPQAAVIAVATGLDESGLRNLNNPAVPDSMSLPNDGTGYDGGSVGVFQQQPQYGWGTTKELMDPGIATDRFLDALVKVPGWESMQPAEAITTVQRNAAGAIVYQQFIDPATKIVAALQNSPQTQDLLNQAADSAEAGTAAPCTQTSPQTGGANIPGFVPGGPAGPNAVAAAASQIGIRYSWGGGDLNGPTNGIHDPIGDQYGDYDHPGWDCSGLARYAIFKATGKQIARTSQPQSAGGTAVPNQAAAQPGDLVFFGGEGTAHHVGIYMGNDQMIDAPESGTKVRIDKVSTWGETATYRRYT